MKFKTWLPITFWHWEPFDQVSLRQKKRDEGRQEKESFLSDKYLNNDFYPFNKKRCVLTTSPHHPLQQYFQLFSYVIMKLLCIWIWNQNPREKERPGPWNWFVTSTLHNQPNFPKLVGFNYITTFYLTMTSRKHFLFCFVFFSR